jgi:ferredoxin-NADP reductase
MRYALDLAPKSAYAVDVLPGEVVRVRFPKSNFRSYEAGQYVFINIPKIALGEWHPFTLSSGPDQDYLEVHVKALGDFTNRMLLEGQKAAAGQIRAFPQIRVDGPYGRVSFNVKRYESIFLVGGGVGVTPSISILRDLFQIEVSEQKRMQHPISPFVKNVFFLWTVKSTEPWSWFYDGLRACMDVSVNGAAAGYPRLRVKGYVTKPDDKLPGLLNAIKAIPNYSISTGRPDMERIVSGLEESIGLGKKRVAVIICGPSALVNSVYDACHAHTKNGVRFDTHVEVFDF